MRTQRMWGVTLASLGIIVTTAGAGFAAERSLVGIVLGRSYNTVLSKYGTPDLMVPVTLPTASTLLANSGFGMSALGGTDTGPGGYPGGGPGAGGPGGYPGGGPGGYPGSGPGGPPGAGGPGGYPGGPGGSPYGPPGGSGPSGPGGPPVLPPAGGEGPGGMGGYGGGPGGMGGGYGGDPSAAGGQGQQGNAVKWVYARPNGASLEFWINEDGRVAQIAATGRTGSAVTSKGVKLGSSYAQVLKAYGPPETHQTSTVSPEVAAVMGLNRDTNKKRARSRDQVRSYANLYGSGVTWINMVNNVLYTTKHHAAFTFLGENCVRITIALAD